MANKNYEALLAAGRLRYGDKFDPSDLDPRFVEFYGTWDRIRVESMGRVRFGRVGVTTGWRPVFLLMKRESDHGSSDVLGPGVPITGIKREGTAVYRDVRL